MNTHKKSITLNLKSESCCGSKTDGIAQTPFGQASGDVVLSTNGVLCI